MAALRCEGPRGKGEPSLSVNVKLLRVGTKRRGLGAECENSDPHSPLLTARETGG